jgi:hypothetical protein
MRLPTMRLRPISVAIALLAAVAICPPHVPASDHADTAEIFNRIGTDMTDVYVFPSPTSPGNVVFVLNCHGLIPGGNPNTFFDPGVLYQFKIDNTGDSVEDLVIQVRFGSPGPQQSVYVTAPYRPFTTGTTAIFGRRLPVLGTINQPFSPTNGMSVFAGLRADPFFFDVGQFNSIFPDRGTPATGRQVDFPSIQAANTPQRGGFLPPGQARDFLAGLNCLSIVVELPRAALAPAGGAPGLIRLWETTSVFSGAPDFVYQQRDRLARPIANEGFATTTAGRHDHNNKVNPTDDADPVNGLITDVNGFLQFPAGRSAAIRNVIKSVLIPDVMIADLSQQNAASYLGYEVTQALSGGTRSSFGGRALTDDVVDISLGIIFGNTIPALGLAPDDGAELPTFTTDNVGYDHSTKHTLAVFPYVGTPN